MVFHLFFANKRLRGAGTLRVFDKGGDVTFSVKVAYTDKKIRYIHGEKIFAM